MGADLPRVTISAATLAGGEKNQDRYAYGDGWAFVLDGASSFATVQPEHDGGWYAERLKNALVDELTSRPERATVDIVASAIGNASAAHDDPSTCPTSTISMARWNNEFVEVYVLGDSTAALIAQDHEEMVTDKRLESVAPELRREYRSRLAEGHGFDDRHKALLQALQARQATARNRVGGYWIAGAAPQASHQGLVRRQTLTSIGTLALATDGAASALKYGLVDSWTTFAESDIHQLLGWAQATEESDALATTWPRSKVHDDKTAQVVRF